MIFSFWLCRCCCREGFSQGVPREREFVSVVNQAIEHGVGQGGIADGLMPMRNRQLAGDQGRVSAVAVFEQCEHVVSACIITLRQSPIIEADQSGFGHHRHDVGIAAIALGGGPLLQEPW